VPSDRRTIFLAMVPLMNRLLRAKIARRTSFVFPTGSRNTGQSVLHNFKRKARPFNNRGGAGCALRATGAIWFKGFAAPLTAAELEMMNLTGDGNGFDMVTMPPHMRERVPTSNFFQRGGYERNPVARRNDTVAKLIAAADAKMDAEARLSGARALSDAYDLELP
jgi:hypothetical protein